jgi:hypothetical protein
VLDSVSNAGHVFCVAEAANVDIGGSAGLVGAGLIDEQDVELVGQGNDVVGAVVELKALEMLGMYLNHRQQSVRAVCRLKFDQ